MQETLFNERERGADRREDEAGEGVASAGPSVNGHPPRGSFGLEFVPQVSDDASLLASSTRAIETISETLTKVAGEDEPAAEAAMAALLSAVLEPMRLFMKVLAKHGAELRIAYGTQRSATITSRQVGAAFDRLDREVNETEVVMQGKFRGMTLETATSTC